MKKSLMVFAFAGIVLGVSGCIPQVVEFVAYGVCDDAGFYVQNETLDNIEVAVGAEKIGPIAPGEEAFFPFRYQVFKNVNAATKLRASVVPMNPNIRSAIAEWNFTNQGYYFSYGGGHTSYSRNRVVRAVVERSNLNSSARTNDLRFRF